MTLDPALKNRIRPMRLSDIPQIVEIHNASLTTLWTASAYEYEVQQNRNAICLVIEDDASAVIGMLVMWVILDEAEIGILAIDSRHRRQGSATNLLQAGMKIAQSRGANQFFLEVRRSNLPAQALYGSLGFTPHDIRKRYYQDNGEDALILRLVLSPNEGINGHRAELR